MDAGADGDPAGARCIGPADVVQEDAGPAATAFAAWSLPEIARDEQADGLVADELVDDPVVRGDRARREAVEVVQQGRELGRAESLPERRRAPDVGEQRRDPAPRRGDLELRRMPAAPDRRLVILAEGNFGFHHGKTAMGVIRFGTDKVVAVIDSTQAGRNVREWLGDSGRFDIPIVDSLNAALGFLPRADAHADRDRAHRRQAARRLARDDPRRDPVRPRRAVRAPHLPGRRPGVRRGRAVLGRAADRLPAPAGADGDLGRPAPCPGQAGDPHGGHRLRHRQDVGRPGAASRGDRGRPIRDVRGHGADRDHDRGLGRRHRPGHLRLRPGDRRVAGRGGRAARRLGDRRGPGVARPPGVLAASRSG